MSTTADSKDKLSTGTIMVMGLAIFSMHFGASCMLWPTTWGRNAGSSWHIAFAGFFISGIILPWLGYLAVSKGGGPLFTLTMLVGKKFTAIFGTLTVAMLSAFFGVPRMSAASWDAFAKVTALDVSSMTFLFSVIFQLIFYAITYWFLYKETAIIDKLSKILVPALILVEAVLIIFAIFNPMGPVAGPNFEGSAVARGFVDGYQTLDLICALMFASIIIVDVKHRLGAGTTKVNYYLLVTGAVGFIIMCSIQCGEMYRGSTASTLLPDVNYAKLSATMVLDQMGTTAGMFFNVCLILACLTTAIGLVSAAGSFIASASDGKVSYIKGCLITSACAICTSILGLATIVKWVSPVLQLIYPPCIALTLCLCFLTPYLGGMRGACYATAIYGLIDAMNMWLPMMGFANGVPGFTYIPGYADGLGFAWFMVAGWIGGHMIWNSERFVLDPSKQASV